MIRFNNDYNHGAHPAVLEALARTNDESYPGYGQDVWCVRAADAIRSHLEGADVEVHFLVGGSQTNYTLIAHALRPWESVISADGAHINVHETGAVEHTGHKIQTVPHTDGKLTAEQVAAVAEEYRTSGVQEHITCPRLVFISSPSELGTIYSKAELEALRAVCDEYGLYLFADGARMGYGLGAESCDVTLADFARLTDAFWIGGTKCGTLLGEALVLVNPGLRAHMRSSIKQGGGLLAKGWLLGLQFSALFENDRYFAITRKADEQAQRIKRAFVEAGVELAVDSPTNQQFVALTAEQQHALSEKYAYEFEGTLPDGRILARFCTSWSTTDAEVDALVNDIRALA